MTSAPLAISGLVFGSNLIQKISPVLSRIVKPGVTPSDFLARIVHVTVSRARSGVGPLDEIRNGHRLASDPIREPARVRNLADRIDVLRTFQRLVAGLEKRILEEVILSADVEVLNAGRVLTLGIAPDRVVGKKLGGRGAPGRSSQPQSSRERQRGGHRSCAVLRTHC